MNYSWEKRRRRENKKVVEDMFSGDYDKDYKKGISWGNDNKYAHSLVGDIYRNTRAYENDWN